MSAPTKDPGPSEVKPGARYIRSLTGTCRIVVDERGLSVFNALRFRLRDHAAVLCAFDLIELDGEDLRGRPLEDRKAVLADLLDSASDGIAFNKHFGGDGGVIFKHACALGCEGIVSKRLGSHYRSGRVDHWLKIKNPVAPAENVRPRRTGVIGAAQGEEADTDDTR